MPTTAHLDILDRSVEKANVWINDVAAELQTSDRHEAYRALGRSSTRCETGCPFPRRRSWRRSFRS